jgi:PAS domain S-box-containing protein
MDVWQQYRLAAFSSEAKQVCDIGMRRPDGSRISVRFEGIAFGPEDDRRCRAALVDSTDRNHLEEQLRLSEARSEGILAISADAIVSVDENQRITSFNEGAEKIFGYLKEEAVGAPLETLLPDRFRPIHRLRVRRFMASRDSARRLGGRNEPIFGLRKDGEEFPVDAAISKIEIAGKRVMTVALRDVSEQKRIEHEKTFLAEVGAVLASTLDYEDTLKNIARLAVRDLADLLSVDIVEEDGSIRRLTAMGRDPETASVSEFSMPAAVDQSCAHLIRSVLEDRRSVFIERLPPAKIVSFPNNEELRALQAAGFKSLIAVPLLTRRTPLGVMVLISASSRLYGTADVRLAEELAQRAALSIVNARLLRDMQRAVKTRENVLAIVSHDLKNPVGTIALAAHLLRQSDQIDAGRLAKLSDTIQRSVDRMRLLITDLLDFAKIQSGTFSVERSASSVSRLIPPVIEGFRLLAEEKRQTLETDFPADLPEVAADARRIGQVMSNLVSNAIKFTPEGGTIRVSARRHADEVIVSVADTGPGIPGDQLSKVFDWFWQAQRSKHAGVGLGLSIAKGIVDAHGGRIWAESEFGQGSVFSFTLCLANDAGRRVRAA